MSILVCGSLAFDTIMTFEGRFAEQILPSQLHILNVSFLVPGLRREYGGCAGNIAYGLRQLGAQAVPLAMLGNDGQDYLARLKALGVDTQHVGSSTDCYTAQAMIMTDRDNNQITAFHPGAMSQAHDNPVPARADITLGIISPDGREAMLSHARQLHAAGVPFVFDPGQGLPMFNGEELLQFVELATWVAVNDYEARMLSDRTGLSLESLAERVQGLIVTLGAQGCEIWEAGQKTTVPGLSATDVVDPTGCGDAFRAALLHGLEQGWALQRCAELGNRMGAAKIASRGGQNYLFSV
ncbi:MAG: carbohydrate kinase family protein [Hydrogenophaga sp.]|uniref:carbohydrate kinase family protein n=1 Tax=Hydrogenophaga sp. TaxID=1904254 RepID=UPI00276686B1|nr:carbohydrate kinase family protein [Hydrogenophaga sp.]MDP2418977.1 carbohydrate kinase family protein [Hydrogenophaga sp.]MDZ4189398.1 carbohydrate kinase family protein [Hydrogenophaga sp.]